MRWHKPSLKGIHSFWGQRASSEPQSDAQIAGVRHAMLQAVPEIQAGNPYARLFGQINQATSLQTLWYLRTDLMAAIASQRGEAEARNVITEISRLFEGLIPEARVLPPTGPSRKR